MNNSLLTCLPRHTRARITTSGLALLFATGLTACGGGGRGVDPSTAAPTIVAQTVAELQPAVTMTWGTAQSQPLAMTISRSDGNPAAGAAVRVFSLSRHSPQDGTLLDDPVPVNLIDSGVSDSAGRLVMLSRLPAHLEEVLVVVTDGAEMVQQATSVNRSVDLLLTLAR
jgi:hypothetical protein